MSTAKGHLTLKDIAELAGVGRPAVSNWRKRFSDFPAPVKSDARKPLFDAGEVIAWLESRNLIPAGSEEEIASTELFSLLNTLQGEVDVIKMPVIALTLLALDKDPSYVPPPEYEVLLRQLQPETIANLKRGIAQLGIVDYGQTADRVLDRILGLGSRGELSQYGTSGSLSSKTLVNAAAARAKSQGLVSPAIIDPACGIGGTLLGIGEPCPGGSLLGADINPTAAAIAKLYAFLSGCDIRIENRDSLCDDPFAGVSADLVVSEPPLGIRFHSSELEAMQQTLGVPKLHSAVSEGAFLLYAVRHLSAGGSAYLVTSPNLLSRAPFREHRERLIAGGNIEAVVQLPAGLMAATRIAPVLWVLRPSGPQRALLIDAAAHAPATIPGRIAEWLEAASSGAETDVPYTTAFSTDVAAHGGTLTPSAYFAFAGAISAERAQAELGTALSTLEKTTKDLMHIRTPRVAVNDVPTSTSSTSLNTLIKAGHFECKHGTHRTDAQITSGPARIARPGHRTEAAYAAEYTETDLLQPGDILMPRAAVPAWVHTDAGEKWVASDSLIVLRPTSHEYDPYFIAACLNAAQNIDSGGVLPRRLPVSQIQIPELSREQRTVIAKTHRSLSEARDAADAMKQQAEQASEALLNLVFSGK